MKIKFIFPIILSILIGYVFGSIIYGEYKSNGGEKKVYFLQQGAYKSKNHLINNMANYNTHMYLKSNDVYYLYVGITSDYNTAEKIRDLYNKSGNKIYIKESYVSNGSFIKDLDEYNKLIDTSLGIDNVNNILKIIVNSYEKNVLNA